MYFNDEKGNCYYTENDKLFVTLVSLNVRRHIGDLTYDFTKNRSVLVLHRSSDMQTSFGYMVSAEPLERKVIDYLIMIVDKKDVYAVELDHIRNEWKNWTYTPKEGYEPQVIIPDQFWTKIGSV